MSPAALGVAGLTPFSSVDYPGQLAAVVFIAGCPWRCGYCHNPDMQRRSAAGLSWPDLLAWLQRRIGLLDAVVFSGGEATLDPALPQALADTRALGFKIGLHTAGMLPQRLPPLLPLLDWVGLDIKAPLDDAALLGRITGLRSAAAAQRAAAAVRASLTLLSGAGIAFECRSTVHPLLHDDTALQAMATQLQRAGIPHWALQIARPEGCARPLPPVADNYPAAALLAELKKALPGLALRRS
ncbi:anaerobic ribonucleoside-triphosphate reductase activating protein [Paucibacter sp. AS339]|uniref:anaerobic ribonucleoside-triphosphate reductase activating protein n=1 Tax=Paucibacter hankyongi TaxID=3133434 RepID=UPI003098E6FD